MLEINLMPFPELQTGKLLLRQIRETDVPEILVFRSEPRIMRYLDRESLKTKEEALQFIQKFTQALEQNEGITWGIAFKDAPEKLIGNVAFWRFIKANYRAELGYTLHPDYWNQGIMSQALARVLDFGFRNLNLHSIEANINPENHASRRLLEKHGFVQEAHFKEDYYFNGKFLDSIILSLIDPASSSQKAAKAI